MARNFIIMEEKNGILPRRSTKLSAGYDIYSSEEIIVPSLLKANFEFFDFVDLNESIEGIKEIDTVIKWVKNKELMTLVPTGISLECNSDECLLILPRSGIANKSLLLIPNAPGLIDADYSGNEIKVGMINLSPFDIKIKRGERIAQAMFINYLTTDNEIAPTKERTGGFGSTGK